VNPFVQGVRGGWLRNRLPRADASAL